MKRNRRNRILWMVILGVIALATLFPMLWMANSSFKVEGEIYQDPPTWVPQQFTLKNYESLFNRFHFGILTRNSVIISLATVAISMIFGVTAAFGFSRYPFPGSNFLLGALLFTRMVTPSSLVVPLFTIMQNLGRLNTLDSIIVGVAVLNLPFVVWIMKPFFDEIPRDIEEAGELDGLSLVSVFWKVALPMAAPGLFTVFLFSFIAGWTELLLGITFSTIPEAMPLTAGLMQMQTGYQIFWGPMMAGGIYLSIPTFIISFALQKYLVKGLRAGY